MNDNLAKTISTSAVWICTAILFTNGVFHFNWNGLEAGFLWAVVSCALAVAPAVATWAIWNAGSSAKAQKDDQNDTPKS